MKVAVIAGTPVDTQMGVNALIARGVEAIGYPAGKDAKDQTMFQILPEEEKFTFICNIVEQIKEDGIDKIMIYCNSLSSSVDFKRVSEEENIFIVTPMDVYRELASNYKKIAVMAGNNQGAAGIERTIVGASPDTFVIGYGSLSIVVDIEDNMDPKDIVAKHGLEELIKSFEKCGADVLILGCTHFPYFKDALSEITNLPIIDPVDEMHRKLVQ